MNTLFNEEDDQEPIFLWEFEEEVYVDERARVTFVCRVLWICCQEQLQGRLPAAWPSPLLSGLQGAVYRLPDVYTSMNHVCG